MIIIENATVNAALGAEGEDLRWTTDGIVLCKGDPIGQLPPRLPGGVWIDATTPPLPKEIRMEPAYEHLEKYVQAAFEKALRRICEQRKSENHVALATPEQSSPNPRQRAVDNLRTQFSGFLAKVRADFSFSDEGLVEEEE